MTTKNKTLHRIIDGSISSSVEGAHFYFRHYYPLEKLNKKIIHIIFQHGAIEYHKRHQEFFDTLREAFGNRIVISCMDLVGHGLSGGSRAYVDKFDHYVEDFLKFIRTTHDLYNENEVETHLIGHSLGGMILIKSLVDCHDQFPFDISSVILTNPCIKPLIKIPAFAKNWAFGLSSKLGKMRLPSLYDGFNLTSDRQRAIDFNRDPLNSLFMTIRMGTEILKESKEITPYSYYIKKPMFFILSGDDEVVDCQVTKLFITGLDSSKTKEIFYSTAKHDILNEVCRKQVFKEIIEYIKSKEWEKQCIDT